MVQDGRLGRARGSRVVVAGDGVEKLVGRVELLEEAQAEVDMAKELPLLGRRKDRWRPQLARPADIVDERGRDEQVGPKPWVDLAELATERCDAHGVLEQATGVRVVSVGSGGIRMERRLAKRSHDHGA